MRFRDGEYFIQLGRQAAGYSQVVESADALEVLTPALRILATYWVYLPRLKTLFTSDIFGHTSLPEEGASWITEGEEDLDVSVKDVREHLICRYFWLPQANTTALRANVQSVFESHEIEVIAPITSRLIVNRTALKTQPEAIGAWIARFRAALGQ